MAAIVLWSKTKDSSGVLDNLKLELGRYQFLFDTRIVPDFLLGEVAKQIGQSTVILGKTITLEDLTFHYRDEKRDFIESMTLHVLIDRNVDSGLPSDAGLINARAVMGGLAVIMGVIAIAFLREVRKVIEPKNVVPLALILIIVFGIIVNIRGIFR